MPATHSKFMLSLEDMEHNMKYWARRLSYPFQEMAGDALHLLTGAATKDEERMAQYIENEEQHRAMLSRRQRLMLEAPPAEDALALKLDPAAYLKNLGIAFEEMEELGTASCGALVAAGIMTSISMTPGAAVLLSGVSMTTKGVCGLVGLIMGSGAATIWKQQTDERIAGSAGTMLARSMLLLGLSSVPYLAVAAGLTVPASLPITNPELVAHFLLDCVAMPLQLANLGYIAAAPRALMLPAFLMSFFGSGLFAVAAGGFHIFPCIGMGAACLAGTFMELAHKLPNEARKVSSVNQSRVQIGTDALFFIWGAAPLLLSMEALGQISPVVTFDLMALVDLFGKLGIAHLLHREKDVIFKAVRYHQSQGQERRWHPSNLIDQAILA